ncbi:hypothetical protein NBRC116601_27840 [Cognatishimia sp. WU-CL00825]|uniref:GNAT family N-acetyltransferase n=1 Tax=Cognatishimia sp. WU-CL00825 TaxID=3127658 RepID=UPI003101CD39
MIRKARIGGVFVPHKNRNRGLAGRLILSHLNELRNEGVKRAILFAASAAAAKAYEKIGFQHIRFYQVALLKARRVIGEIK